MTSLQTCAERTALGLCSVNFCGGVPVTLGRHGYAHCARCWAVLEQQSKPAKGRAQ